MQSEANRYAGLWRRLVLSRPGAPVDTLTEVGWIQGPARFVDIRRPPAIAGRIQASCLAELTRDEALALAAQEGFAGRFELTGDTADWHRAIDFQPAGPLADRGRIEDHGELLVEHGIEADYIEHWQREPASDAPCWAAQLRDAEERLVVLVRCGDRFGYARDRAETLAPGGSLADLVTAAGLDRAQALVDCEIALGTIAAEGWRIDRSTLPWREGMLLLGAGASFAADRLTLADMDPRGLPVARDLRLEHREGTPSFAPLAHPAAACLAPPSPIPVVDIAALGGSDAAAEAAVVAALRAAAGEVGFLHVTGHGIAPAVIARLHEAARAFFAQPEAVKRASYIGHSSNHRGYVPEGEEVFAAGQRDRKEAFDLALDLGTDVVPGAHPLLGPNQWPDLPGFREDVMAYYAAAFAVGRRLLRGFAMALGRPADSFDHLVGLPPSQLRLIHYPFVPDMQDVPGIGAHTDYECFTLLLATEPGLEVMDETGCWIDAPPVPGALVVNIGDMMEFWSGGRFVATSHRVRKVAQERYSFPLFFALDYDVELTPLDRRRAAVCEPIRTGEHLYAQTVQTFRYLQQRAARGELVLPPAARPLPVLAARPGRTFPPCYERVHRRGYHDDRMEKVAGCRGAGRLADGLGLRQQEGRGRGARRRRSA